MSNVVIVEKANGKISLCLYPRNMNKVVRAEHFQLPTSTVGDIMAKMPNANIFSKLDASSGHWRIKVDNESADLLTFNSSYGHYRFNRALFRI